MKKNLLGDSMKTKMIIVCFSLLSITSWALPSFADDLDYYDYYYDYLFGRNTRGDGPSWVSPKDIKKYEKMRRSDQEERARINKRLEQFPRNLLFKGRMMLHRSDLTPGEIVKIKSDSVKWKTIDGKKFETPLEDVVLQIYENLSYYDDSQCETITWGPWGSSTGGYGSFLRIHPQDELGTKIAAEYRTADGRTGYFRLVNGQFIEFPVGNPPMMDVRRCNGLESD